MASDYPARPVGTRRGQYGTLYRQVAPIEEAMALMSSRRLHRFLDELIALATEGISVVLSLGAVPTPDDDLERTVRFVLEPLLTPPADG